MQVFGHDGHPLGVDSAQVCIFEEPDKVGFGRFLEGEKRRGLEPAWIDKENEQGGSEMKASLRMRRKERL
jgi:hypothetical protein